MFVYVHVCGCMWLCKKSIHVNAPYMYTRQHGVHNSNQYWYKFSKLIDYY